MLSRPSTGYLIAGLSYWANVLDNKENSAGTVLVKLCIPTTYRRLRWDSPLGCENTSWKTRPWWHFVVPWGCCEKRTSTVGGLGSPWVGVNTWWRQLARDPCERGHSFVWRPGWCGLWHCRCALARYCIICTVVKATRRIYISVVATYGSTCLCCARIWFVFLALVAQVLYIVGACTLGK